MKLKLGVFKFEISKKSLVCLICILKYTLRKRLIKAELAMENTVINMIIFKYIKGLIENKLNEKE